MRAVEAAAHLRDGPEAAPHRLLEGGEGGQRPRRKYRPTGHRPLPQHGNGRQRIAQLQRKFVRYQCRKFAWWLGRARTFIGSSKGSVRPSWRAPSLPARPSGSAGAGNMTFAELIAERSPRSSKDRTPRKLAVSCEHVTKESGQPIDGEWWDAILEEQDVAKREHVRLAGAWRQVHGKSRPQAHLPICIHAAGDEVLRRVRRAGMHLAAGAGTTPSNIERKRALMRGVLGCTRIRQGKPWGSIRRKTGLSCHRTPPYLSFFRRHVADRQT